MGANADAKGRTARELAPSSSDRTDGVLTMPKPNDLSRSPVALDDNTTLIAVIEMGLASWLIAGRVPGVNRRPLRKLRHPSDQHPVKRDHRRAKTDRLDTASRCRVKTDIGAPSARRLTPRSGCFHSSVLA